MCDDSFDINAGNVVCRQLGYAGAKDVDRNAHFGEGSDPIWLDDVQCLGTETSLYNCTHAGFGNHDCGHEDDVGVVCLGIALRPPSTRQLCCSNIEI